MLLHVVGLETRARDTPEGACLPVEMFMDSL